MELRTKVHLPSYQYKLSTRCSRCFLERAGNSSFEVLPMNLSKFEKKLVVKANKKDSVLTGYQSKYLEELKKKYPDGFNNRQNTMVITCKSCKEKSSIRMVKPKSEEQNAQKKDLKDKKKAKKKKDKNCGLKAEAVLEASMKKGNIRIKKNKSKENVKIGNSGNKSIDKPKVVQKNKPPIKPSKQLPSQISKSQTTEQQKPPIKPRTRKSSDRVFATSDFIPLTTEKTKFKLTKKKKEVVQVVQTKAKRKRKKKGPKTLSEKAKLELLLQNL